MDLARFFLLRSHKRYSVNLDVTVVETKTGREMDARIADVSLAGVQVLCEDSFDAGVMIDLWFMVPAADGDTAQTVIASGKVANCSLHSKGQRFEIGVSLKKFDGDGKAIYERYIQRLSGHA